MTDTITKSAFKRPLRPLCFPERVFMQSKKWIKNILKTIAVSWEENLCSRRFLVVSGDAPNYDYWEIIIQRSNLLHLTGITTSLSADEFFMRSFKGSLRDRDFSITEDHLINKLIPLSQCPMFFPRASKIGRGRDNRLFVSFDIAIGPMPCILFRKAGSKYLVPVSFMSIHIAKIAHPVRQIRAVFWKGIDEINKGYSLKQMVCCFNGYQETALDLRFFS